MFFFNIFNFYLLEDLDTVEQQIDIVESDYDKFLNDAKKSIVQSLYGPRLIFGFGANFTSYNTNKFEPIPDYNVCLGLGHKWVLCTIDTYEDILNPFLTTVVSVSGSFHVSSTLSFIGNFDLMLFFTGLKNGYAPYVSVGFGTYEDILLRDRNIFKISFGSKFGPGELSIHGQQMFVPTAQVKSDSLIKTVVEELKLDGALSKFSNIKIKDAYSKIKNLLSKVPQKNDPDYLSRLKQVSSDFVGEIVGSDGSAPFLKNSSKVIDTEVVSKKTDYDSKKNNKTYPIKAIVSETRKIIGNAGGMIGEFFNFATQFAEDKSLQQSVRSDLARSILYANRKDSDFTPLPVVKPAVKPIQSSASLKHQADFIAAIHAGSAKHAHTNTAKTNSDGSKDKTQQKVSDQSFDVFQSANQAYEYIQKKAKQEFDYTFDYVKQRAEEDTEIVKDFWNQLASNIRSTVDSDYAKQLEKDKQQKKAEQAQKLSQSLYFSQKSAKAAISYYNQSIAGVSKYLQEKTEQDFDHVSKALVKCVDDHNKGVKDLSTSLEDIVQKHDNNIFVNLIGKKNLQNVAHSAEILLVEHDKSTDSKALHKNKQFKFQIPKIISADALQKFVNQKIKDSVEKINQADLYARSEFCKTMLGFDSKNLPANSKDGSKNATTTKVDDKNVSIIPKTFPYTEQTKESVEEITLQLSNLINDGKDNVFSFAAQAASLLKQLDLVNKEGIWAVLETQQGALTDIVYTVLDSQLDNLNELSDNLSSAYTDIIGSMGESGVLGDFINTGEKAFNNNLKKALYDYLRDLPSAGSKIKKKADDLVIKDKYNIMIVYEFSLITLFE